MKKSQKVNQNSVSMFPKISHDFLKDLVTNKSEIIKIPILNNFPVIELKKRQKQKCNSKKSYIFNMYLDEYNKNYPQFQLNSSKVNVIDFKNLDTDFSNKKEKYKSHKCHSKSVNHDFVKSNYNHENYPIPLQKEAKYIKLIFEENNKINNEIQSKLKILRKYMKYTYDLLTNNIHGKKQINDKENSLDVISVDVDNDLLDQIKPMNLNKNKSKEDIYNPCKLFVESIRKMQITTNSQKSYKKVVIDNFLDAVLDKISRKVCYINDKNIEITKDTVINLMQDEVYHLTKNFEGIIEFPVFLKHFSTKIDKTHIFPLMNEITYKYHDSNKYDKKDFTCQSLEPIRESRDSSKSRTSNLDNNLSKKLRSNDFFNKINSKNNKRLNNEKASKNNSNSNNYLAENSTNIKINDNSNSYSHLHLEDTKIISTNRNNTTNPLKNKKIFNDIEESHEVDFNIIKNDRSKSSTIKRIFNENEETDNNKNSKSYIENILDKKGLKDKDSKLNPKNKYLNDSPNNRDTSGKLINKQNLKVKDIKKTNKTSYDIEMEEKKKEEENKIQNEILKKEIERQEELRKIAEEEKEEAIKKEEVKKQEEIRKAEEEKKIIEEHGKIKEKNRRIEEIIRQNKEKLEKEQKIKKEQEKKRIEDKKNLEKKLKEIEFKKFNDNKNILTNKLEKDRNIDNKRKESNFNIFNKDIRENYDLKDDKTKNIIDQLPIEFNNESDKVIVMPVFNPLKLKELQQRFASITKKDNNENKEESNRNLIIDEQIEDKFKDLLTIETKRSVDTKHSKESKHTQRGLDSDRKYNFFEKEVKDTLIEKQVETKTIGKKIRKALTPRIKKIVKVSINDIISKLNRNPNSNNHSIFKELAERNLYDFIKKKYAKQLLIKPEILKLEDIVTEEEKIEFLKKIEILNVEVDRKLSNELKQKRLDLIANDIFEEIQHHLSKTDLTAQELTRLKELKSKLDNLKTFHMGDYIVKLEQKYSTFFDEMEILNEARKEEERINSFISDLNHFRMGRMNEKDSKKNKVKIIDRRPISKLNPILNIITETTLEKK